MHGHVQQGAQFLVGETLGGLAEQALDGGAQGAVARETHIAQGEQAEAIQAGGVAGGIEAAIVVVAAPVGHLAEVAEGGGAGSLVEGGLELREGDRGVSSEQGEQQVGRALGHVDPVYSDCWNIIYTVSNYGQEMGPNGCETAQFGGYPRIQRLEMRQYAQSDHVEVQLYQ